MRGENIPVFSYLALAHHFSSLGWQSQVCPRKSSLLSQRDEGEWHSRFLWNSLQQGCQENTEKFRFEPVDA